MFYQEGVALGYVTRTYSTGCIAIGSRATAGVNGDIDGTQGRNSTAIGDSADASNNGCLAIGNSSTASGSNSMALGVQATASGDTDIAIGQTAIASGGSGAIAPGRQRHGRVGLYAMAIGRNADATATDSIAIGRATDAAFTSSIALGATAVTTETDQLMLGPSKLAAQGGTIQITSALELTGTVLDGAGNQGNTGDVLKAQADGTVRWEAP